MTLDEYLESIDKKEALIQGKVAEYEKLFSIATKMTGDADGMPHGTGVTDKVGNFGVKLAYISQQIDALIDQKADIVKIMEKLPPNEYRALHRHYVLGMTWEDAAADMYISVSTIYRLRDKGRESLRLIVDDIE